MSENHPGGYLKYARAPIDNRDPSLRIRDYRPIHAAEWREAHLREQGERCMDCGVATCMGGCPIGNLIPDWNDLVSRAHWREALERLHATNNFPEFTGYTCPAPCEPACVLAREHQPVTIKSIERAIIDMGWREGWIRPLPPLRRSGKHVAVVGSGPAGLACAQQLNRAGHRVTVYERDEVAGGLVAHGIPDFKFDKAMLGRRLDQLTREGVGLRTGCEIGRDLAFDALRARHDAVCLAIGAQAPRDLRVPGRELAGVHLALDYLICENRRQGGRPVPRPIEAHDRHVIVLGGGDTGADCVATAHRQRARSVTQVTIDARRPLQRGRRDPWPWWPRVHRMSYALEEGGRDEYQLDATAFLDDDGDGAVDQIRFARVRWHHDAHGRRQGREVIDADVRLPAGLVLIATGFSGPAARWLGAAGIALDERGTIRCDRRMMTSLDGVFAAGDAQLGPSLVVWAIGEGRDCARAIDDYLGGTGRLPASLRTRHLPLGDGVATPPGAGRSE